MNETGHFQPVDVRFPVVPKTGSSADPTFDHVVFRRIVLDLSAAGGGGFDSAGTGDEWEVTGTGLRFAFCKGGDAPVEVQYNGEGDFVPWQQGDVKNPAPFEKLRFRWDLLAAGAKAYFEYWTDAKTNPIE